MKFNHFNVPPIFLNLNKKLKCEKMADGEDQLHNVASNAVY